MKIEVSHNGGIKKFQNFIKQIPQVQAKVGWIDGKKDRTDGEATNAEIANSLIKGNPLNGQVPRDFFNRMQQVKKTEHQRIIDGTIKQLITSYEPLTSNKNTIKKAIQKIGVQYQSDLKLELKDNAEYYAENKESTLKAWAEKHKKDPSGKKLFVDSGKLINSIVTVVK